jgi:cyclomaltodextrinase / maltogenic alpha-amylase / neopullulanase
MTHWVKSSIFYHIYPLGFCGAPQHNDFSIPTVTRLEKIYTWLDHIQGLGANAIYLGPVFESTTHGYDTADYFWVDRRLGTNQTLADLSREIHRRGMRLILDGVFNHVGRDFWAFRDVREKGADSPFCSWFQGLKFGETNAYGDPFSYEGWQGHLSLVKLNLSNADVRNHLFEAVSSWVREFDIDGLRLDAADCVDLDFWQAFSTHCHNLKPEFWLMGEIVHGNYTRWANPERLDAVTNYECYKGLYSSLNDANYFEIAYALDRQFGPRGIYKDLPLYAFADNHDVDRVASLIKKPELLYPLYLLLLSMPGVPSLYYGSEWGLEARRHPHSDAPVRPSLDLAEVSRTSSHKDLASAIARMASIRRSSPALCEGSYHALRTDSQQMAFLRQYDGDCVAVILNASNANTTMELKLPVQKGVLEDLLNPGERFDLNQGKASLPLTPYWGRVLRIHSN